MSGDTIFTVQYGVLLRSDRGDTNKVIFSGTWTDALAIHGRTVFLGASDTLLRSTNGGDAWESLGHGLPPVPYWVRQIEIGDSVVYSLTSSGIYYSDNNGMDWARVPR